MSEQFEFDFNASPVNPLEKIPLNELMNKYKEYIGVSYRDSHLPESEIRSNISLVLSEKSEIEKEIARLRQIDTDEDKRDLESMYRRTR